MALDLGELNAIIDADDRGFNRTVDRVDKRLGGLGRRMTSLTGILSVIGKTTALATIATGAAGAVASIGPLIAAVGTLASAMGGLAAATPAFLAGGAAAAGTLAIGFSGLGDALAGDEEALAALAPAAREVVSTLQGLAPAWEQVTRNVQSELWAGVASQLDSLASKVLPRLDTGLTGIAGSFNTLGREALEAAGSEEAMAGLESVLDDTADAVDAFAGGIEEWITGLGMLLESTSPLLVDAGEAAARLGERFRDWIADAQATGRINDLLDTMKDTLSTLWSLIGNVGSILSSVFGAANTAGGGLLETLEQVTGRFADWLQTAEGTEAVNAFFEALAEVAAAATPVVLAIADAFATELAPQIADIATNIGPSLETVIGRLGDAIGNLDVASLAETFGRFLEAVSLLLVPLSEVLNVLIALSPVLLPIASAITILVGAFKAYQAIVVIATVVQWAWNAALFANPITWIILAIVALIAIIILLVMHWEEVVEFLEFVWAKIKMDAETIWNAIADFFVGIWEDITSYIGRQVDKVEAILDWFGTLPGKFAEWIGGVKDSAIDRFNALVDWVEGIPGMITGALGDLGSLLWDAGKDLLQGFIDGIESMWQTVQNKLSDLTSMLPDWKGPESVDRRILAPSGEMVIGGFVDGIEDAIPSVQRALSDLTGDIGLQVDQGAAPQGNTTVVNVPDTVPAEFTATATIDLGEGIERAVDIKLQRSNRDTRRRVLSGTGANQ
ncbi:hypothetical protein GCM10027447_12380 [Glycomyces halotolerans]